MIRILNILLLCAVVVPRPRLAETDDAVIFFPTTYKGTTVYWLHGHNGNAYDCPAAAYYTAKGCIVVSPKFREKADWEHFDLRSVVSRAEALHVPKRRIVEGYSRGALGAALHAEANPGLFDEVNFVAGAFHGTYPRIAGAKVRVFAGLYDAQWRSHSIKYAENRKLPVMLLPIGHDLHDFYKALNDARRF